MSRERPIVNQAYERRELLETVTCTVVGGSLMSVMSGVVASQSNSTEEWPQPLYNATNSGYAPIARCTVLKLVQTYYNSATSGRNSHFN